MVDRAGGGRMLSLGEFIYLDGGSGFWYAHGAQSCVMYFKYRG